MIQYENILPDDMARYWGQGFVFVAHGGYWNAYSLLRVEVQEVTLALAADAGVFGTPTQLLTLSYPAFFQQAMLHRPSLGVLVQETGDVWGLGWQHADGLELAKAIRAKDVYAVPVHREATLPPGDTRQVWAQLFADSLLDIRDKLAHAPRQLLLDVIPAWGPYNHRITQYVFHTGQMDKAHNDATLDGRRKNSISLVLEFLNQTSMRIQEALPLLENKPRFLSGTSWLLPDDSVVWLMNGAQAVGNIDPHDGKFIPLNSRTLQAVGRRVYEALF